MSQFNAFGNGAGVGGCGGGQAYIDWPGGCPYFGAYYGWYPGAPGYGQGGGQQADAQAQRVVNNIYLIKKEDVMSGGAGVGAGGAAVGFDMTMNIAPGYALKIDPYRGNGNVVLAMTLETPYGPVEGVGRLGEDTLRQIMSAGRARLAPRIQRWLQRMMQKYGAGNAMALPPSTMPAPSVPAIDILDIDAARLAPGAVGGAGVGQMYGGMGDSNPMLDMIDVPQTMDESFMADSNAPAYPITIGRRHPRRPRPAWLRRNWYWWYMMQQNPYYGFGWYNPYYPSYQPWGPYYLNGRWVYGPPQLQGATYTVNGQPVSQGGQPLGSPSGPTFNSAAGFVNGNAAVRGTALVGASFVKI